MVTTCTVDDQLPFHTALPMPGHGAEVSKAACLISMKCNLSYFAFCTYAW